MVRALLLAALKVALLACGAAADDFDALRSEFLASINAERAREGVGALKLSPALSGLAQQLADEAARHGNADLAETSEVQVLQRAEKVGYSAKSLAVIFTRSEGSVADVTAFWRERGGRTWRSLLRREFQDVGVGGAMLDEVPLYVFLLGVSWEDYAAARSEEYRDLPRMRRQMLARVNAERSRRSLPLLAASAVLDRVAQAHADDMLRRSYYGHKSPNGETVRERALAGGYRLRFVGENIASGQSTVDEVMDGWMASDEHRPNILSKVFTEAGFGLAIGRNKGGFQVIWVQVFGRL
ncbi:MAG TPA: CAP domain-containing protein [Thermoanaerobaculia bacterium]